MGGSRHSKNAGDRHHFTYQERAAAGIGTQKTRYGADSQLPFGNCCLCLQTSKDPMATPSGHLYCRECILQYLLAKTKDLKRQRAAYEAQQKAAAEKLVVQQANLQIESAERFVAGQSKLGPETMRPAANAVGGGGSAPVIHGNTGIQRAIPPPPSLTVEQSTALVAAVQDPEVSNALALVAQPDSSDAAQLGKRSRDSSDDKQQERDAKKIVADISKPVDDTTLAQHRETLKRTSFWLPTYTPEHIQDAVAAPESRPRSPMSNEPLRTKDLIPVHFTLDSEKDSSGVGSTGRIVCAVTHRELSFQPAVLIATSGKVMLQSAAEEFALPTKTCPVTGKKFKKSELITLVKPGSSFSASGKVVSEVYEPPMM